MRGFTDRLWFSLSWTFSVAFNLLLLVLLVVHLRQLPATAAALAMVTVIVAPTSTIATSMLSSMSHADDDIKVDFLGIAKCYWAAGVLRKATVRQKLAFPLVAALWPTLSMVFVALVVARLFFVVFLELPTRWLLTGEGV